MEEYYTVEEIAKILRFSKNKTYNLVNQKDFPKVVIGRQIRIPKDKFEEFMKHLLYKRYEL